MKRVVVGAVVGFLLFVGVVFGGLLFGLALSTLVNQGTAIAIGMLSAAAVPIGVAIRAIRRRRRRFVADLGESNADSVEAAARIILPRLGENPIFVLSTLGKYLVSAGQAGHVVRFGPESALTPVEPITVPFEPLAMDEFQPRFSAFVLASETSQPAHGLTARLMSWIRQDANSASVRRLMVRSDWVLLGPGIFCLLAAADWARTGFRSYPPGFTNIAILCVVVWFSLRANRQAATEISVVPAGLVAQIPGRSLFSPIRHLFDRRNSVLCLCPSVTNKFEWQWVVADGEAQCHSSSTAAEVQVLLRAWLSPLEPPSLEQLENPC
ncbi:MAG: hypothetical protein HZB38_11860 [Planctomycetes bacterium]|nr:hypothetical protein [Planctomycetota bacterium]